MYTNKNASDVIRRLESRVRYANYLTQRTAANDGLQSRVTIVGGSGSAREASYVKDVAVGSTNVSYSEYDTIIAYASPAPAPAPEPAPAPAPAPGPSNLVTTNLLIELDASNPDSYPGSGTTWTDICGGSTYNGTLTGTVSYSSNDGGILQLDATGLNYIEIANAAAIQAGVGIAITAQVWMKVKSFNAGDGIISKQFGGTYGGVYRDYDGFSLVMAATNKLALNMNGSTQNNSFATDNNVFDLDTWTFFTVIARFGGGTSNPSKIYVNTTEVLSQGNTEGGLGRHAPLGIGRGFFEDGYNNSPEADVGAFYYYNRALSAAEIADNYNATKARYGIV